MERFKRFYVWSMNAKCFMGLYWIAVVFFAGLLRFCFGESDIALLHLAQMLLAVMVVAFSQALLQIGSGKARVLSGRSVLWALCSTALIAACSYGFGWFAGLPVWCGAVLAGLMLLGFAATLVGISLQQQQTNR